MRPGQEEHKTKSFGTRAVKGNSRPGPEHVEFEALSQHQPNDSDMTKEQVPGKQQRSLQNSGIGSNRESEPFEESGETF